MSKLNNKFQIDSIKSSNQISIDKPEVKGDNFDSSLVFRQILLQNTLELTRYECLGQIKVKNRSRKDDLSLGLTDLEQSWVSICDRS